MVGALILARAVDDEMLSTEILNATAVRLRPEKARVEESSEAVSEA